MRAWAPTACRLFFVLLSVGIMDGQSTPPPPLPAPNEETLATMDEKSCCLNLTLDGRHVAWGAKREGKWVAVVDGQVGPPFDEIVSLALSADGSRYIYEGRSSNQSTLIVDGKPAGTWDDVAYPTFSLDGKQLAYAIKRKKRWSMMLNGTEQKPDGDDVGPPIFSLDGKRFAFPVRQGPKKWSMVVNGKIGDTAYKALPVVEDVPRFTPVPPTTSPVASVREHGSALFSPDGSRFAYMAEGEPTSKFTGSSRYRLVVDGVEGPVFDAILDVRFTDDGKHLVYRGLHVKFGWIDKLSASIVIDGKESESYEGQGLPDQQSRDCRKDRTYCPSSPGSAGASAPAFDNSFSRVIYAARQPSKKVVVIENGRPLEGLEFENVWEDPIFTEDGKKVAYLASRKGDPHPQFLEVVDHKVVRNFELRRGINFVSRLRFSPDGSRLAYLVGVGGYMFSIGNTGHARRRVVADGAEQNEYNCDELSDLRFSPDSKHFSYAVHNADKRSFVVVDGQESKAYERIFANTVHYRDPHLLSYIVQTGRTILRVAQPLK